MALVSGYSLVPEPPAKIIPFMKYLLSGQLDLFYHRIWKMGTAKAVPK